MGETAIWQTEGERKRAAVSGMFGSIARGYDRMNGLMSFGLHHRWRGFAVSRLALKSGDRALDVCCGTGDFMLPLRKAVGPMGRVVGVDFCLPMLEGAKGKLSEAPSSFFRGAEALNVATLHREENEEGVGGGAGRRHAPCSTPGPSSSPGGTFVEDASGTPRRRGGESLALGDACRLPIASNAFDAVSVGWGLRNVPDLGAALSESARALKPGGRFVSLDMARPRNPLIRKAAEFSLRRLLPLMGRLLRLDEGAYAYLPESTLRFASRETLAAAMERAGFVDVAHRDLMLGNLCVHWGRKP